MEEAMEFHPIAELFPLMNGEEFEGFKADIAANGLIEPIWTYEGKILDGRNRYRACTDLGLDPRVEQWSGKSPHQFVLSENLHRRHLTSDQRAMIAVDELPRYEAEAKKRMLAGGYPRERIPQGQEGTSRDLAAKDFGTNGRYISDAKKLKEEDPELAEKVLTGEIKLTQAKRQKAESKRKEDLQRPVAGALPQGLYHGDFRELSKDIPDDSVELVLTDPPYDEGSIHLYGEAAEIAKRILKPGGSFVSYSGQRHLPDVLNACSEFLEYHWIIGCIHGGGNQIMNKLGIRCGWKPMVWFVKEYRGDVQHVMLDMVTGSREKQDHQWQQAEAEASYIIENLTSSDGLVVDFFLGSGTTAIAANKLGRQWIGYEENATTAEKAASRINDNS